MIKKFFLSEKGKYLLRTAAAVAVVTLMVFISDISGEKEIIFPELAALALGAVICERMPWRVSTLQMAVFMTISAFLGWFLAKADGIPVFIRIMGGFIICSILLIKTKSTMLPVLSACILPILTNAQSILYPLSVIILTSEIILIRFLFKKWGIITSEKTKEEKLSRRDEITRFIFVTAVLAIVTAISVSSGFTYLIAPPLIVAFAEISYPESPAKKSPLILIIAVIMCCICGTAARLILCETAKLPLFVGVFVAVAASFFVLTLLEKPFPPAAALAVLPFILPHQAVVTYPLQSGAGIVIFVAAVIIYDYVRKHLSKKECGEENDVLL